jgi:hypothetical protein
MLGADRKARLAKVRLTLQALTSTVPSSARRLHRRIATLQQRAEKEALRRLPWGRGNELEDLESEATQLDRLGSLLSPLLAAVGTLEARVDKLARLVTDLGPASGTWLGRRCAGWRAELVLLGADLDRPADIDLARLRLESLEEEVRLTERAAESVLEARRTLEALGQAPQAAGLAAALPRLERQLIEIGPSETLLADLKALVEPLLVLVQRSMQPPEALGTVSSKLREARGWFEVLEEPPIEAQQLEERHRFYADHWFAAEPQELERLVSTAEELRRKLENRALDRRLAKLKEIEEALDDLTEACGGQPELRAHLTTLRNRPVEHYSFHPDWLLEAARLLERLRAVAGNHELELEKRLEDQAHLLKEQIAEIQRIPLSTRNRARVEQVTSELAQLARGRAVNAILPAVSRMRALRAELDSLEAGGRAETEDLTRLVTALGQRAQRLLRAAQDLGLPCEDVGPKVTALSSATDSLEEAQRAAQSLNADLDSLERSFVDDCKRLVDHEDTNFKKARRALREAGLALPASKLPSSSEASSIEGWVQAVLGARTRTREIAGQIAAADSHLQERRLELANEFESLRAQGLGPADLELLEELVRELRDPRALPGQDPLERLASAEPTLAKARLFQARLRREQEGWNDRRERLRRALKELGDANLVHHLEGHLPRASALVYGLLDAPLSAEGEVQLDLAETLLDRLTDRARRLEAESVEAATDLLEQHAHRGSSLEDREAKALLVELQRAGQEALPPVALRLRLLQATSRLRSRKDQR